MTSPSRFPFRPSQVFTGSCHCGVIRYELRLALPDFSIEPDNPPPGILRSPSTAPSEMLKGITRIYKCNCTVCQKMAFFHVRPGDPEADFVLLKPLDLSILSKYQTNEGFCEFYFCPKCGVRCFTTAGPTGLEKATVNLKTWRAGREVSSDQTQQDTLTEVLRPGAGWHNTFGGDYLSINGHTLDADQEGLDLREWVEKNWIGYGNRKTESLATIAMRFGQPYEHGTY